MRQAIRDIKKSHFAGPDFPIKWNFRDLKGDFPIGPAPVYDYLLQASETWRTQMFEAATTIDMNLLICCVQGHSAIRRIQRRTRDGLTRYVFVNGLLRFGLHVKDAAVDSAEVILDWPDRNNRKPFDDEYYSAYNYGISVNSQPYHCGKLCDLHFADSPFYANMNQCSPLQFSDLIIGATRDFVQCAINDRRHGLGARLLRYVVSRFRGFEGGADEILNRGIVITSDDPSFREQIKTAIKSELLPPRFDSDPDVPF